MLSVSINDRDGAAGSYILLHLMSPGCSPQTLRLQQRPGDQCPHDALKSQEVVSAYLKDEQKLSFLVLHCTMMPSA